MRRFWVWLVWGLSAWVGAAVLVDSSAPGAPAATYDVVVVLGCRPLSEGKVTWCIQRRVERGVALVKEGRAPRLWVTGGVHDGGPSEAAVGARLAARMGWPVQGTEDQASSTRENALFVFEQLGDVRVLLVTDPPHAWRAHRTFRNQFSEVGVQTTEVLPTSARVWMAMREVLAIGRYSVAGWLRPKSS